MSTVQIDLELVTKAFESALDNSKKKTEEFQNQATKSFGAVGSAFSVMAGSLAAGAITKALGLVVGGFSDMINEAIEAENELNTLNSALKTSGQYSQKTSDEMVNFQDSLASVTTLTGGAVAASQAYLLSLTNLTTKGVNNAITASADLAAALNIDLSQATDLVAKAINGNTTAFKKMGIEIKAGSTDTERLSHTLDALSKFSGAAEAKTNTFSGALAQQKEQYNNLLENLGGLITKNDIVIASIKGTTSVFASLSKFLQDNSAEINTFVESLKITIPILAVFAGAIGISTVGFTGLAAAATTAWTAITGPVGLAIAGIVAVTAAVYAIYRNWELVKATTYEAMAATLEYSAKAVGLLSKDRAQSLLDQANGYREQATAIREAKAAVEEKAATDETAHQNEIIRQKQKAEMMQATEELRKELRLIEEEARIADDANELVRTDEKFKLLVEQLGLEQAIHRQAQMNITTDKIEQEKLRLQTQIDANKKKIKDTEEMHQKVKDAEKEHYDKLKQGRIEYVAWEDQTQQQRVATTKDTLGQISGLTRSGSAELFEIGKAAAITNATIDGYAAVQKALASLPPPFNFAAAALVGVATAANVSSIANQSRPKFAQGGIVPGNSFTGDRVQAQINSGEMILNRTQQSKLYGQINSGESSESFSLGLERLVNAINSQVISIAIDGREIASAVRDQITSGRSIA